MNLCTVDLLMTKHEHLLVIGDGCLVGFPHEPAYARLRNGDMEAREIAEPLLLLYLAWRGRQRLLVH